MPGSRRIVFCVFELKSSTSTVIVSRGGGGCRRRRVGGGELQPRGVALLLWCSPLQGLVNCSCAGPDCEADAPVMTIAC